MKNQRGMTLIELMLVTSLLSVLALLAFAAYDDYATRAHVSDGLSLVASAKTAVSETRISNGTFPDTNTQAGLPALIRSQWVESLEVSNNGLIIITFDVTNTNILPGEETIEFTPSFTGGGVTWQCTGGSLIDKYRPGQCR